MDPFKSAVTMRHPCLKTAATIPELTSCPSLHFHLSPIDKLINPRLQLSIDCICQLLRISTVVSVSCQWEGDATASQWYPCQACTCKYTVQVKLALPQLMWQHWLSASADVTQEIDCSTIRENVNVHSQSDWKSASQSIRNEEG